MVTATCRSWRCEGECRRHNGKVTWARIVEALQPHDERDVLFAVLTIDRNGHYSRRRWDSSLQAYRELSRMMGMFLKRLNRMCERAGVEGIASRWVAVVEQHRSGWPHVNLLVVCPALAAIVRAQQAELDDQHDELAERVQYARERERCDFPRFPSFENWLARKRGLMRGEVLRHCKGAGWGRQSSLEVARSRGAVAGYLVKLCGLHDTPGTASSREKGARIGGEVVKLSQIPMSAPKGFRRLRSGVRFLPPRRKSEYTGALFDEGMPVEFTRMVKRALDLRAAQARRAARAEVATSARAEVATSATRAARPLVELVCDEASEAAELATIAALVAAHERDLGRLRDIHAALTAAGVESRGYRKIIDLLGRIVDHTTAVARGSPANA